MREGQGGQCKDILSHIIMYYLLVIIIIIKLYINLRKTCITCKTVVKQIFYNQTKYHEIQIYLINNNNSLSQEAKIHLWQEMVIRSSQFTMNVRLRQPFQSYDNGYKTLRIP